MDYIIYSIADRPDFADSAAEWFHEKWGVPAEAYRESIEECLSGKNSVPQWYIALSGNRIVGGLGVIENDFHDRVDLAPNVCAVYVEEDCRKNGIAGELLKNVCRDMANRGVSVLYLITDHTSFYERYGWEFLCMAKNEDSDSESRIYVHRN